MAVYQGTRLPAAGARLPAAAVGARGVAVARPQAAGHDQAHAGPRVRPASMLLMVILAATLLGFAYLTQTLDSTATSVEIRSLEAQALELQRRIKSQDALVLSEASSGSIRDRASAIGLSEREIVIVKAP